MSMVMAGNFIPRPALAFTDGSGWASVSYLIKILEENYKRYKQLQSMINSSNSYYDYIRLLNAGLDNSIGLLDSLPIKDEKLLNDIHHFKQAVDKIELLYGKIPKSPEEALHLLHDQTVAESLRMAGDFKSFSEIQERNSEVIAGQARLASPKGAARMQAETSAEILRTLSQLIRLNTQILKLQSEQMAMQNKAAKDGVSSFQKINTDLGSGFTNFKPEMKLVKF
ncbi:MAG: hypothetical protein K2Q26_10265 [Bdellovibrionales bacterium]|nr:hypothetical protein [Bdellovibrionales bacterium]